MVPRTLNEWTIEVIEGLLIQAYYETREFEFKEQLPDRRDIQGKTRLEAACCSFANSSGGFLVFGVTDQRTDPVEKRLAGISPGMDFPEHFGVYPQKCTPSIRWEFRQPALPLPNGNLIHVVQIPRSWIAPHFYQPELNKPEQWRFVKRTDKGVEVMSYEELKLAFLQYYEKRLKLQLLRAELENIREVAQGGQMPNPFANEHDASAEFSLTIIETVLTDVYSLVADHQSLLRTLNSIRMVGRQVNQEMQKWLATGYVQLGNRDQIRGHHNSIVNGLCQNITRACDAALKEVDSILEP